MTDSDLVAFIRARLDEDERAILVFSALCHDFAKPKTTMLRERDGKMRWSSWGHEPEGGPMARAFLERIHVKAAIVDGRVARHRAAGGDVTRDGTDGQAARIPARLPTDGDRDFALLHLDAHRALRHREHQVAAGRLTRGDPHRPELVLVQ